MPNTSFEQRVYAAHRIDSKETAYSGSSRSSNVRKLLMLSGNGRTDDAGECSIPNIGGNSFHRYFDLYNQNPPIPEEWGGASRTELVFTNTPQVLATPSSPGPVVMTVQVDLRLPAYYGVEPGERGATWDLDGGDVQIGQEALSPPRDGRVVSLVFRTWQPDGQVARGVDFSWQLLGEARFMGKRAGF